MLPQADVAAHALAVVGLLHHHFSLGPHVSPALLHAVEGWGIAIAVASTLAAACGEVLSLNSSRGRGGEGGADGL